MAAKALRFQVRKRETTLTPTLAVQNCTFSNSEFQLHSSNFFLLSKPLLIYNIRRSRSGSNQPKALSIASREDGPAQVQRKRAPIKKKLGFPKKKNVDILKVPLDSLLMGIRSKIVLSSSLAMSTQSQEGSVFDL
jgi:hypothetical protein